MQSLQGCMPQRLRLRVVVEHRTPCESETRLLADKGHAPLNVTQSDHAEARPARRWYNGVQDLAVHYRRVKSDHRLLSNRLVHLLTELFCVDFGLAANTNFFHKIR